MEIGETISLTTGLRVVLLKSRSSVFLTEKEGLHLILTPLDGDYKLSEQEIGEMWIWAERIGQERTTKEGYRPIRNSEDMGTAKHFHIHILLPQEGVKLRRIVDPSVVIRD
jgi:hypothetical protein